MPTRTKSGALPPPAPAAAQGPGPREQAARIIAQADGTMDPAARMLAWLVVEVGRQGDLLDRLTNLLPAAEAAAARLAHPIRGAFGRGGPAGTVDMTGGKPR
jgi:hypothetical protein